MGAENRFCGLDKRLLLAGHLRIRINPPSIPGASSFPKPLLGWRLARFLHSRTCGAGMLSVFI
jgi:hypothetical protein